MLFRAAILASVAVTLLSCAPPPDRLSGVYSNVRASEATGDLGGLEVALEDADLGEPSVVFTICEGGCYGGDRWPVTIEGDHIAFSVTHEWERADGTKWRETETYEGTIEGDVLSLRSPQVPGVDPRLTRVAHPKPGQTARLAGKPPLRGE